MLVGPALLNGAPFSSSLEAAQATKTPNLSISVSEVIIPITVTDEKGKFVSDLKQADFKVFDENKEQKISYFNAEREQHVSLG